ncbi:MAG: hypothetical protein J6I66_05475 [Lachnospiraceae bacterium]|nr:hypothetical protein [Lachnospiraceae bacterium]
MDSNNMNNQNYQQPYQQPVYNNYYQNQIPDEYKPISVWGYLGYELLFALPLVGFIITIIMAFAPENKNVKNFARSYLLAMLIIFVIIIIVLTVFGAAIVTALSQL